VSEEPGLQHIIRTGVMPGERLTARRWQGEKKVWQKQIGRFTCGNLEPPILGNMDGPHSGMSERIVGCKEVMNNCNDDYRLEHNC